MRSKFAQAIGCIPGDIDFFENVTIAMATRYRDRMAAQEAGPQTVTATVHMQPA
ncbi:MAG: hypothetical protein M3Y65_07935 [Pseudomonadota bacterium]|nr:hypothetical protein [Pseudomonadota bacterium]